MFKKPILKPFALCGTASILVILKHATDPADPLREVIGFFFDEAVCELCYGHLDVFPKLDVVASLLETCWNTAGGVMPIILDTSFCDILLSTSSCVIAALMLGSTSHTTASHGDFICIKPWACAYSPHHHNC